MACFVTNNLSHNVSGRYIYLDNDFLGEIFTNKDLFTLTLQTFETGYLLCDPLTKLEFLRDVFLPQQFILKKEFLESEIFSATTNHQELFNSIQDNALYLSRIYRHQQVKEKISTIDLLLAGRVMYHNEKSLIATGNKKDFPSCVFECVGVINVEQNDSNIKALSVLKFSQEKFNLCNNKLQDL